MTRFAPARADAGVYPQYVELFASCFPATTKFNQRYLEWLYRDNPSGPVVGFDAWDGEQLAAHYVGVVMQARIAGKPVRALLSLNTATHPKYQGRGLFTQLAERTYEAAAAAGVAAVFGVANANSTPGFVRKLGFQLVEPLAAKVGLGSLGVDPARAQQQAQFHTAWSPETLAWRCGNPNNPIGIRAGEGRTQFFAAAMGRVLPAYAELPLLDAPPGSPAPRGRSPLRLYLGLEPAGSTLSRAYVEIPRRLRPSPLNFIYRPLAGVPAQLEQGSVRFSFLDFDAY
jgi:GNAT superfamily N-acetyltransferase